MPPTNYVWMEINLKGELIGVYEWYDGKWRPISIKPDGSDTYTKDEIDALLQYTEQEIINKLLSGEYEIITIDDELSEESENPVQNKVITAELNKKLDKVEFYDSATQASLALADSALQRVDTTQKGTNVKVTLGTSGKNVTVAVDETALDTTLDGKVDKVEGSSLMTAEEHSKLAAVEAIDDTDLAGILVLPNA